MTDENKITVNTINAMSKYLRPDKFEVEPNSMPADVKWIHWYTTFTNFLQEENANEDAMKLKILINHLSPSIYSFVRDCLTYDDAMKCLDRIYNKPKNIILARHMLTTRRQQCEESVSDFARALKLLAQECKYEMVTAQDHENQSIRGAFIVGISSQKIKERLLENLNFTLDETLNQAISLEYI